MINNRYSVLEACVCVVVFVLFWGSITLWIRHVVESDQQAQDSEQRQ